MTKPIRWTLWTDGTSDAAMLQPILEWCLQEHWPQIEFQSFYLDPGRLPPFGDKTITEKIELAVTEFPCEILFYHRDAETQKASDRVAEIQNACQTLTQQLIAVVPVRMTEAWLLIDAEAIREAAGNRAGKMNLALPPLSRIESISDPKDLLHSLLREASGLSGRKLKKFSAYQKAAVLSVYISDWSPLRKLSAFQDLELQIQALKFQES
jgi:hypothetical protein